MSNKFVFSVALTRKEQRWALIYLISNIWLMPTLLTSLLTLLIPGVRIAQLNFIWFAVNFLCISVLFRRFWAVSINRFGYHPIRLTITVLTGLCVYFAMTYGLSHLLLWLSPGFFNVNDSAISHMFTQDFTIMALGTVFLVPAAEEFLYRGFVFGSLYNKNPMLAYLISICLFCSIHILGYISIYDPITLLLCFVQYIPAGICLGWAYRTADSIFAPILMHTIINVIGISSQR